MGVILNLYDKLSNVMSGMGTSVDRGTYAGYHFTPTNPLQAEAAYRTSWLMRKIIDIPPLDMTREWRNWQAADEDIEVFEREERRLQLREKAKRALILARLYGGAVILIGIRGANPEEPLIPEAVGKDNLAYLHVLSRHQITPGREITDPESEFFGQPESYQLNAGPSKTVAIHPSRVVPFIGQKMPEGTLIPSADWFWGDPLYQSIEGALKNADLAQDGFASLIDEAKVDIVKMPGLMANVGTSEYASRLLERLGAAAAGKSRWRMMAIDGEEEWEQRQITWAGMPEIIATYLQMVSGAADIPVTRLLGQSPKGLQSTGDGEERDYHAMISARQEELLTPALDRIDEVLIRSALGSRPDDIWWKFNSLERLSPKDAAEIEVKYASALKSYSDMGVFPDVALTDIAKNRMVESGQWPGSETAFEAAEAAGEEPPGAEEDLLTAEEIAAKGGDPASGGGGGNTPARLPANDAKPIPLYVHRKLLNASEVVAWAKSQGLSSTLTAGDMHVTVLYSRTPVDPIKMGESWGSEENGGLIVKAGGPRAIERLGEDAVVLLFASWSLVSRHNDMVREGASHDYSEYQPHITISYEAPADLDLSTIKPFSGELRFGPEIFEPLDLDWKEKVVEA